MIEIADNEYLTVPVGSRGLLDNDIIMILDRDIGSLLNTIWERWMLSN